MFQKENRQRVTQLVTDLISDDGVYRAAHGFAGFVK